MTDHKHPEETPDPVSEAVILRLRLFALADDLDALAERVRQAAVVEQAHQADQGEGDGRPADTAT